MCVVWCGVRVSESEPYISTLLHSFSPSSPPQGAGRRESCHHLMSIPLHHTALPHHHLKTDPVLHLEYLLTSNSRPRRCCLPPVWRPYLLRMWSARSLVPRGQLFQALDWPQLTISALPPRLSLVTPVDRRDTLPLPAPLDPLLAVPVSVELPVVVVENVTDAASPVTS
jgi:hypothetical protein